MADFDEAVSETIQREGGAQFVDHPNDPGGATRWGISLRTARDYVDLFDVDGDGEVGADDIKDLPREAAVAYYRKVWDRIGCDQIDSHVIAAKVFDLAVNMGDRRAIRLLQRACRATSRPTDVDGILGPNTLERVNSAPKLALLAALRSEARGFYETLMAHNADLEVFRNGWIDRAYA